MPARLGKRERATVVRQRDLRLADVLESDGEVVGVVRVVRREIVRLEIRSLRGGPLRLLRVQIAQREIEKRRRIACDQLLEPRFGGERIGVDIAETAVFLALQAAGLRVVDGQQAMMRAREIKNQDEVTLLTQACAMVDGVYQDIFEFLKPGIRESDVVALAHAWLFEMGSEFVEAINSIAGERCAPHPHVFSDRLIRPGDQAYFDIIHVFNGYRTCYYRTFVVGRATQAQRDAFKRSREWMDAAIALVKPGATTDQIAKVWPKAEEFGFEDERRAHV